jgi:hypothetical protein
MSVLVQDSAESIGSANLSEEDLLGMGERFGQYAKRRRLTELPVWRRRLCGLQQGEPSQPMCRPA